MDNLLVNGPIEQNVFGKGGVYEAMLIQRKSMTLKEYKEKVCPFDKMGEGLKPEEVESKVNLPLNFSFGRIFVFHLHSTELIY
jgi:jumonji domain-containing protein 2